MRVSATAVHKGDRIVCPWTHNVEIVDSKRTTLKKSWVTINCSSHQHQFDILAELEVTSAR
jgi:hypothetical protein